MNETPDGWVDREQLRSFLDGTLDPATFDHGAHVRMARAVLAGHDFLEAAYIYDRSLRRISARAGDDSKRSVTKTLAFLSIIAETGLRPDSGALAKWYSPERLEDPAAGDRFLMPDGYRDD